MTKRLALIGRCMEESSADRADRARPSRIPEWRPERPGPSRGGWRACPIVGTLLLWRPTVQLAPAGPFPRRLCVVTTTITARAHRHHLCPPHPTTAIAIAPTHTAAPTACRLISPTGSSRCPSTMATRPRSSRTSAARRAATRPVAAGRFPSSRQVPFTLHR